MIPLKLQVNGQAVTADVAATTLLIDLLRGPLALTGTHAGCDTAQCGACTVLLDGQAVKSCSVLAVQAQGCSVTTVEGLASDGRLHPVQEAFLRFGGAQCGICTPGFLVTAKALLDANPHPTRAEAREALAGNLCRCTGYQKILDAVTEALAGPDVDAAATSTPAC